MRWKPFVLGLAWAMGITIATGGHQLVSAQQTPKPISDIKDVAGKWFGQGWSGGSSLWLNYVINEDGTIESRSQWGIFTGTITQVIDGKARYKNERGQTGTLTLYEDKGVRILKYERDDGTSYGQLKQTK